MDGKSKDQLTVDRAHRHMEMVVRPFKEAPSGSDAVCECIIPVVAFLMGKFSGKPPDLNVVCEVSESIERFLRSEVQKALRIQEIN